MSIHCIKCESYVDECYETSTYHSCDHRTNRNYKKNWLWESYTLKKSPKKLNKNMNCKNYKAKRKDEK